MGRSQCLAGRSQCLAFRYHANVEILTPPYLLNADGSPASRPTILSAPANAGLGSSISVSTDRAVSAFALMRLSSATHSLNNEQRRVPLSFSASRADQYVLQIPGDSGVAVPGYYMLFAVDANGVPSVSTTIQIH
ncbi:galactose oxidase early set domain-containing protein [Paraburkholderia podalyriae]|nr:galactose oxidase early set domain-containing protein [Paraburkholderia podalyriae]